jgi:hypothetical protein
MNIKKISLITFLCFSNLAFGTMSLFFYFGMRKNFENLNKEETHYMEHMALDNNKLNQFVFKENIGLTREQFIKKYNVTADPDYDIDENEICFNLLCFEFRDGVLSEVR